MNNTFIGENLRPGQLGHFFIILSFVASLFSAFCYIRAVQTAGRDDAASLSWRTLARNSFIAHTVSIIGVFAALYYIITHHLFEYNYAWQHSSRALPMKYLFSCFWEGQEGSFMLWTFWHGVLGLIVMRTSKALEPRVMTIIALVQVCLSTMLLGFVFSPELKIGSTPFTLLRQQMAGAPIFADPNYLANFIRDGNGLNIVLQNYWMVIHPPVLFLGFASTLIPFSFLMAGLWGGDYKSIVTPMLRWSLFSGAVLGTGIMMGGAWAYESLTFGGYWAWDPVENASLVPWITLIAGLHTLVIYKATGRSFILTTILYALTYLLVWYSTFLTRTGVLGDTSVHAFTGEGKSIYWHLIIILGLLIAGIIFLIARRWKALPRVKTEEHISSREFWMFVGSFVLLLSSAHIIVVTSIPIWSPVAKWFTGKDVAPPANLVQHYNGIQVWVAVATALLAATVLLMKFKKSEGRQLLRRFGMIAAIAVIPTLIIGLSQHIRAGQYIAMLFAASFGLTASIYYAFFVQQGSLKKRGAALSHFGFATILIGLLLSSYNKEVISLNTTGHAMFPIDQKKPEQSMKENGENVQMFRNVPMAMGDYFVTYLGDSVIPNEDKFLYKIRFERRDSITKKVLESFVLHPDAFINNKGEGNGITYSANPAKKHYLSHDLFTYITPTGDPRKRVDTAAYQPHTMHVGDTTFLSNGFLVLKSMSPQVHNPSYHAEAGDIAVAAQIALYDGEGARVRELSPVFFIRGSAAGGVEDTASEAGLYTRFSNILPEQNAAVIETRQTNPKDDFIVLKAMIFPHINVLALGILIMVSGFLLSLYNRLTKKGKLVVMDVPREDGIKQV